MIDPGHDDEGLVEGNVVGAIMEIICFIILILACEFIYVVCF